jgi:hypothetical protein
MQTVMTVFIERVRYAYNTIKGGDGFDLGLETAYKAILNDAEEMIKQEMDMVEEAFYKGQMSLIKVIDEVVDSKFPFNPLMEGDKEDAQDYYNQIYGGTYGEYDATNKE